jgi:hypothetical protein
MNLFIEDINNIKNQISILEKKMDEILVNIKLLYVANSGVLIKKKTVNYNKTFVYSSTDDTDYSTDSECGCGSLPQPQKEDPEISSYIKKIMANNEHKHNCSCGCGKEFF